MLEGAKKKYVERRFLVLAHWVAWCITGRLNLRDSEIYMRPKRRIEKRSKFSKIHLTPSNCMTIDDLIRNVHQKNPGKFLLCRSIVPVIKKSGAYVTVVDDPAGRRALRLGFCNKQDDFVPVGTILVIRDPWLRIIVDGGVGLNCDKISDVLILTEKDIKDLPFPVTWKASLGIMSKIPLPKRLMAADVVLAFFLLFLSAFIWMKFFASPDSDTSTTFVETL